MLFRQILEETERTSMNHFSICIDSRSWQNLVLGWTSGMVQARGGMESWFLPISLLSILFHFFLPNNIWMFSPVPRRIHMLSPWSGIDHVRWWNLREMIQSRGGASWMESVLIIKTPEKRVLCQLYPMRTQQNNGYGWGTESYRTSNLLESWLISPWKLQSVIHDKVMLRTLGDLCLGTTSQFSHYMPALRWFKAGR